MAATLTETLNSLYTTTWAMRRAGVTDQVFEKNYLWLLMKSKGMVKSEETAGRRFEIPMSISDPRSAVFFTKGYAFSINDFDPLTVAYDNYKNLGDQIIRYWEDDKMNGGSKTQHLKLMNSKLTTLKNSFQLKMEIALWNNTGGSTVLDFNGLPFLIQSSPSTSTTIHGLNQATQTDGQGNFVWRNQQKTATGAFSVYGESDMTNLMNTCNRWGSIDSIISDQTTYELGIAEAIERVRVVNKEAVDLGLDHITFMGRIWTWSPRCTSGASYFIDRDHLGFTVDPSVNMDMTDWKQIPNQYNDVVAQIALRGNLWRDKAQCHGVLTAQAA